MAENKEFEKEPGAAADTENRNAGLEEAIQELKNGAPEADRRLKEELVGHAALYAPMQTREVGGRKQAAFAMISDKEKKLYYAMFTSRKKAEEGKQEGLSVAELDFGKLLRIVEGSPQISGIVLNPGTENFVLGRQLFLEEGRRLQAEADGQTLLRPDRDAEFTAPTGEYEKLLDALKRYMGSDENISAAYLRELRFQGELCYAVIVNHIHGIQPSFRNISKLAESCGTGRRTLVISARSEQMEKVISEILPFYRKPFSLV